MPRIFKNCIGFGINLAEMIHHYTDIWKILGQNRVYVVPIGEPEDRAEITTVAQRLGYTVIDVPALIDGDAMFETFVTHQYLGMVDGAPIFKRLGQYNLRFMYSLAQDGWNFADWNAHYDGFLCYGPYQAEQFAARFPGRVTAQMGYPRYDGFFAGEIDTRAVCAELSCDPAKPTIVWLPTYSVFSSVDRYCDVLASLTSRFNVVVKPHPMTTTKEPHRIARINAAGFTTVITGLYDNLKLYAAADYIVCDYGGPIFGALYTDSNLLLLDLKGVTDHDLVGADSPEIRVRRAIVSTDSTDSATIAALLDDQAIWWDQKAARRLLRQEFFAPFYGFSAQVAAVLMSNAPRMFGN
jgi:hypothetical protein